MSELLTTHNALRTLRVHTLSMSTLDGHLSEMLLSAKIGELVVSDLSVVVAIVTEDILGHVFQLVLVFLQQANQGRLDLFLAELLILVAIVRDE